MLVLGSVIFKGYIVGRVVDCVRFTGSGHYSISVCTKYVEQLAEVWTNRFSRFLQKRDLIQIQVPNDLCSTKSPFKIGKIPWQTSSGVFFAENFNCRWLMDETPPTPPRIMASKLYGCFLKWRVFHPNHPF